MNKKVLAVVAPVVFAVLCSLAVWAADPDAGRTGCGNCAKMQQSEVKPCCAKDKQAAAAKPCCDKGNQAAQADGKPCAKCDKAKQAAAGVKPCCDKGNQAAQGDGQPCAKCDKAKQGAADVKVDGKPCDKPCCNKMKQAADVKPCCDKAKQAAQAEGMPCGNCEKLKQAAADVNVAGKPCGKPGCDMKTQAAP